MSNRARSTRPPTTYYAPFCEECGAQCIVAPLGLLVRLQREHPVEGMTDVLEKMRRIADLEKEISVCPGCGLTTVAWDFAR